MNKNDSKSNKNVEKSLSQEEMTAISNIQSILSEIMEMNQEDMVMESQDNSQYNPDEDIEKGLENTTSDASTASDDAEERIDETQTEETEDNVNDIAKALKTLLMSNVKKDQSRGDTELQKAVLELVKVQKSSQDRLEELSEAFENILKGFGIAKQIEVMEVKKEENTKPSMDQDNQAILSLIQKTLSPKKEIEETHNDQSNGNRVHKNLRNLETLRGLLGT